jgi:hypothetical protein
MYLVVLAKGFAKDLILCDVGALQIVFCHQDDLMLSSYLADDLNSCLGRSTWSCLRKFRLNLLANFSGQSRWGVLYGARSRNG